MPPAAIVDPEGSAAIDNLARRTDFAGKAILSAIGKIADPDQQQTAKNEIVTLVERFREPVTGLVETTGGTTMPATDPAKATVQQREELEDRRFDPGCRRTYRQQAAAVAGPFNYAKILVAQIGYLSPDESEAATDSELSLLKLGYYPRNRWQISGLNYRLGGVAGTQLMMVSRLDGPDANLVHDTIVDSLRAELQGLKGKFVIDSRGLQKTGNANDDAYAIYDISLRSLAAIIRQKTTIPLVFDERPEILPAHSAEDVALYCGWYSLANHVPECAFVPGAVGFHVASLEMTSLRDPANNGWVRGLLKDGVAATLGPVSEPYLQSFPLADEFFPLLLTGKLTLAEVFWKTELMNSWRQCLIGDPLYNPFLTNPAMKVSDLPPMLQRVFGISMTPTPAQSCPRPRRRLPIDGRSCDRGDRPIIKLGECSMPCQLICPNLRCRKILSVPDNMRGKVIKCQQCQTSCRVPAVRSASEPAQARLVKIHRHHAATGRFPVASPGPPSACAWPRIIALKRLCISPSTSPV